ncbi:MAG: phospho-N-acetylmuramoyl-pentapeptide-transferase [Clostridiales bacterium]|nr:phospho-N-acetylmuramoyl-pentapeptide-transferase [Clostridiales bacterium]
MATATSAASLLALAVTALLGFLVIPFLRRLKFGQNIKTEYGPEWHKSKQGTPTMGGVMLMAGVLVGVLGAFFLFQMLYPEFWPQEYGLMKARFWGGLLMAFCFGVIGLADDYIKVVKKRNLGLTAGQKSLLQFLVAAAYAAILYLNGERGMYIPFIGDVEMGLWYIPVIIFIVVGAVNAVNLTDGIDGLASSITFFVGITFMVIAGLSGMFGISMAGAALAGACLGFLVWNFYPARVFMGDTGSLFLGGMVCMVAFGVDMPLLLLPAGIVYVMETLSVILQVGYFKLTHGKRLFKMSPLHHHFEMCGRNEVQINVIFGVITVIGCAVTVALAVIG